MTKTDLTYLSRTSRLVSTDRHHKFWPASRSSVTMQAGRHSIRISFPIANNKILKLTNQQSRNQSLNKVAMVSKIKWKLSVMSSMCAVASKQTTTTKKLPKRPRKKTMISEINLLNILKKDQIIILVRALPLLCQILDVMLLTFVLKVNAETTQLLQRFLVLQESYPLYLRLILLK